MGTNLKRIRILRGLTQEELASAAETSREYIARIEGGEVWISAEMLSKLSIALRCEESELLIDPKFIYKPNVADACKIIQNAIAEIENMPNLSHVPADILLRLSKLSNQKDFEVLKDAFDALEQTRSPNRLSNQK